jgi:DNA-binding NarL/FixJ family response regulator
MALKKNRGDTQHIVGTPATDRLPSTTVYLPLSPARERTKEGRSRSRLISVGKAMVSLGVIDEKSLSRECITKCLQALDEHLDIVTFATCEEYLEGTGGHDVVLYHIHQDISKWIYSNDKLTALEKLFKLVPVIILSDIESPDVLLDMFESGARGFISTDNITLEQIIDIIGLVKVGGIFVSVSNLSLRRKKKQPLTATPGTQDQFTPSERAVLDRLKLGKANKIIAHELGLSESTVKVHIGSIMKKLKVTNRTQIVCRTYQAAEKGLLNLCIVISLSGGWGWRCVETTGLAAAFSAT